MQLPSQFYLLGLIRGHWQHEKGSPVAFGSEEPVNIGIATVTPIEKVLMIMQSDELKKQRRKMDREHNKQNAPVLDSGFDEGFRTGTAVIALIAFAVLPMFAGFQLAVVTNHM